jgi:PPOX class probable F420-dependent enzyme
MLVAALPEESPLKEFEGHKYISVETYRKDGRAVRTPVWFVSDGLALYVRTYEDSGKVKRIKKNKKVRAAPCSFEGAILGNWLEFEPEFIRDDDARLKKMFSSKYGMQVMFTSFLARLRRKRYVMLKLSPKHS